MVTRYLEPVASSYAKELRRLREGEIVVRTFPPPTHELKVAFATLTPPLGMYEDLGAQLVFALMRTAGFAVERFFSPSAPLDGSERLETLEGAFLPEDADVLALSVPIHMRLPELVRLFHALKLAPLAAQRPADAPLVIMGGHLAGTNPALLGPFADVVLVGEADAEVAGQSAIAHLLGTIEAGQRGRTRRELLQKVAREVPGALVLSGYRAIYGPNGRVARFEVESGFPAKVQDLVASPRVLGLHPAVLATKLRHFYMDADVVPQFPVEAMRGCADGCGFCSIYAKSPPRVVPRERLLENIRQARAAGLKNLWLVAPSMTDYPDRQGLFTGLDEIGLGFQSGSTRADRMDEVFIRRVIDGAGERPAKFAIAPETFDPEVLKRLGKALPEPEIRRLIELTARVRGASGRAIEVIDLFIMLTEWDSPPWLKRAGEYLAGYREILDRGGMTDCALKVPVNPFMPQLGTPLQREYALSPEEYHDRLDLMKSTAGERIEFITLSPWAALVEPILARGDPDLAEVTVRAVELGNSIEAWQTALAERGKDLDALRARDDRPELTNDMIISRRFKMAALAARDTRGASCYDHCYNCGQTPNCEIGVLRRERRRSRPRL